jgi:hypothetical protein
MGTDHRTSRPGSLRRRSSRPRQPLPRPAPPGAVAFAQSAAASGAAPFFTISLQRFRKVGRRATIATEMHAGSTSQWRHTFAHCPYLRPVLDVQGARQLQTERPLYGRAWSLRCTSTRTPGSSSRKLTTGKRLSGGTRTTPVRIRRALLRGTRSRGPCSGSAGCGVAE